MSKQLHIVILAAGQGKRMKSSAPKVLAPLAGRPMLAHVLDIARTLEPAGLHVVVGHGADQVRGCFEDRDVEWVDQPEQLGTGHAVQMALPGIPDDSRVLVLLGDMPLVRVETLEQLLGEAGEDGVAVLTARVPDPYGYGRIVRNRQGGIDRIVEHRDADDDVLEIDEVNSGVMAAPKTRLDGWLATLDTDNAQGEYYLTDVVGLATAEQHAVKALVASEAIEILGANDRWQLAELERHYQRRAARDLCLDGATLIDPDRFDVRGSVVVDGEVVIDVNCVFEGRNIIGEGVHIGAHCVLIDCDLGPGTRIHPHSVLDGVVTEGHCDIGPFARLRPGTRLATGAKIGNFVETKKATFGKGSKASHLSYLGDTELGSGVNIGAGTITCNYDGANKYRTEIGDDAFIGSDTQLVAPVKVGAGATIGAGSTITRDAPEGELTLSRPKQVTIKGWKRPVKKKD